MSWAGSSESFRFLFLLLQIYRNFKNKIFEEFLFYRFIFWSAAKVLQLEILSYWNACLTCRYYTSTVYMGTVSWSAAVCRTIYIWSFFSFLLLFHFIVSNYSPIFFLILGQNKMYKLLIRLDGLSQCPWTGAQLCWDAEIQRASCVRMWWPIPRKSILAIESEPDGRADGNYCSHLVQWGIARLALIKCSVIFHMFRRIV